MIEIASFMVSFVAHSNVIVEARLRTTVSQASKTDSLLTNVSITVFIDVMRMYRSD